MNRPRRVHTMGCLAFLCLIGALRGGAASEPDQRTATLERLPGSPLLLTPPDGVEGDFDVAGEAPELDFAVFPNQWEGANLWSAWGDSLWASDGNVYASIGDHDGPRGASYVYRVDPTARRVDLIVEYNEVAGVTRGPYSPGKIHAPICEGPDGWLYLAGYRGSVGTTTAENGYKGDWLLRYHMASGKAENLGILVPYASVPSMEPDAAANVLYGLGVPGKTAPEQKPQFFAYDIAARTLLFSGGPPSSLNRSIIVAADGRAYYANEGHLVRYDPALRRIDATSAQIPGNGTLRAASRPGPDGVVYCFTSDGVVFSFDPQTDTVTELLKAFVTGRLYIASCELDPSGRYLYYVPSAHGGSRAHGTALIQLDVKTRRRKVIAFLNEHLRQSRDYNLGGTYGLALARDGSRLFINWNGNNVEQKKSDFGLCSAMVVHIPESER